MTTTKGKYIELQDLSEKSDKDISIDIASSSSSTNPPPSILVVRQPSGKLSVAATPEGEEKYYQLKETDYDPNNIQIEVYEDNNALSPTTRYFINGNSYQDDAMRIRRRKFLISLLASDILYCLLLLSTRREFAVDVVLLIGIVLVDILGIIGTTKDHLNMLTAFIMLSSVSIVAQSVLTFSPWFVLRILVVLMAFRVRGELILALM
eukprot:TRINITY_DN5062_c0_g1_i1.p1 TRINITY_DN5062_c0_g1~~TRINITY_DN5062_c0_g1_i1.p1  ORF type:complete len:207 (-),score=38.12 TRINITY_DN5062_c0_g1_i1:13-633(-)